MTPATTTTTVATRAKMQALQNQNQNLQRTRAPTQAMITMITMGTTMEQPLHLLQLVAAVSLALLGQHSLSPPPLPCLPEHTLLEGARPRLNSPAPALPNP